jgi:hypothetical protein
MRLTTLIALLLATLGAIAAPPRKGIQDNLATYVAGGVITQAEAKAIQTRINNGLLRDTFVPAGTRGTNYWVQQDGTLRSKQYAMEAFDVNEDNVSGRYARTDGCHIWLRSCDNLFVPAVQPPKSCPPPPPCDTITPILPPPCVVPPRPVVPLARLNPNPGPQLEKIIVTLQPCAPPPCPPKPCYQERVPLYGGIRLPSEVRTEQTLYFGYYSSQSFAPKDETCGPYPGPGPHPPQPPPSASGMVRDYVAPIR